MSTGNYYISRVITLGDLNKPKFIDALLSPTTITKGNFLWTFTDIIDNRQKKIPYIYGNLTKFKEEGKVKVVDEIKKYQSNTITENLIEASSPFVYLPEFSGLIFLHNWNGITDKIFPRRFKTIIEETYDSFFVDCTIEPIADHTAFLKKLESLSFITELSAKVHPPNPLFGRLWKSLNDYIKSRNSSEISVKEKSDSILETKLLEIIENQQKKTDNPSTEEIGLIDAAMLMAADGYGSGKAIGYNRESSKFIAIRTSDSHKTFVFSKDPDPDLLAERANEELIKINKDRDLQH